MTRRKVGRTVVCTLRPDALTEARAWLSDVGTFWDASLDRLDQLLEEDSR